MDIPVRTLDEVFAVCRFMADFAGHWWIGGGWAIDLWCGSPSRDHEDIEICVLRSAQHAVHTYCAGWEFWTPVDNQWAPLPDGKLLDSPEFMLQLRQTQVTPVTATGMPPTFEFLLNDITDAGSWQFLPDPHIHLPLAQVYGPSPLGMRVTMPEIVLLHKALYVRPKDEHDFQRVRNYLHDTQRSWLADQLGQLRPEHPWLAQLTG